MKKRFSAVLSVLLVLSMVLSCIPATAFATEQTGSATEETQAVSTTQETQAVSVTEPTETVTITEEELRDKVLGSWIGQMVGVAWAYPTEFDYQGVIMPEEDMPEWTADTINNAFRQDDIYVEIPFIDAMMTNGAFCDISYMADCFRDSTFNLWHANLYGRENLRDGMTAPDSGKFHNCSDDIDWQIESDFVGTMYPGLVNEAAARSFDIGHIMNYGDGVYGGVFMAAMHSAAFTAESLDEVIEAGLAVIPDGTTFKILMEEVMASYNAGDTWQENWQKLEDKYGPYDRCSPNSGVNIDAKLNAGYVLIGLLYGEGDFAKTILISTQCGQDSDCNPSSAAAVLGNLYGASWIEDTYKGSLDYDGTNFRTTEYSFNEAIDANMTLMSQILTNYGATRSDDGVWTIPVSTEYEAVPFEQYGDSFDVYYIVKDNGYYVSMELRQVGDEQLASISVDLGDGCVANEAINYHIYDAPGTYTIRYTAVGTEGTTVTRETSVTATRRMVLVGTPFCSETAPTGGGNKDISVIADGVTPAVGYYEGASASLQYDTYHGSTESTLEYAGLTFAETYAVSEVEFTEGLHFYNGGWFKEAPYVEALVDGVWTKVESTISPAYPTENTREGQLEDFQTFTFTLAQETACDGIRVAGVPGGTRWFVSFAEIAPIGTAITHEHCVCGGAAVGMTGHTECETETWLPISIALKDLGLTAQTANLGKLPEGNYYLDTDLVVTAVSGIPVGKDLKICLNGHSITTTTTRVFGYLRKSSSLSVCDCSYDGESFGGTIYGGTSAHGSVLYTYFKSTLNIYGGNWTGSGTAATSGGVLAIASDVSEDLNGDGSINETDANLPEAAATFNLWNGKIYGGQATTGGNVTLYHSANVNMYGGIITGGTATTGAGGNIFSYSFGTITVSGGEISGGTAATYGGNISSGGTLNIDGATITGGQAQHGGNLYIASGTAAIKNATISDGKANLMTDGTTSGNGGNILSARSATTTISGCTITGGEARRAGSVGAWGNVTIENTTITGGYATYDGGNIMIYGNGQLTLNEGTVLSEGEVGGSGAALGIYANAGKVQTINTGVVIKDGVSGAGRNGIFLGSSDLVLSGDPQIGSLCVRNDGEGCSLTVSDLAVTTPIALSATHANVVAYSAADPSANFTVEEGYTMVYTAAASEEELGTLSLAAPVATADGKSYATVSEAISNTQTYVKLIADVTEDVIITGDVYLDLAGHTLTGNITGEGTLYGMDSATDEYTTDTMGRITGTVSCNVAGNFKTSVTGSIRRYLAISDDTGYTFHRIYLGITKLNLKPSTTGVGYKAVFYGDDMVKAQLDSFGYTMQLDGFNTVSRGKSADSFESGKTVTLRINNYDVENYGETALYASVYMQLSDGTIIQSAAHTVTLRGMVESVNASYTSYSDTQLAALESMIANNSVMQSWTVDNLYKKETA